MSASLSSDDHPDADLQLAIGHHQARRFEEAERLYLSLLQSRPDHALARHNLGLLEGQRGAHQAALPHLRAALELAPDEGQFWLSYARGLLQAGQAGEALAIMQSALARGLDNDAAQALLREAQAAADAAGGTTIPDQPTQAERQHAIDLYQAGRYAELERSTAALTERYPDSPFAWSVLGTALQAQGKDALATLRRSVQLAPHDAEAHASLGDALQGAGRIEEALPCYLQAIDLRPDFAEAHANLGSALQALGRPADAEGSFRHALAIRPDYALARFNLGNALQLQGKLDAAAGSYRAALALMPDDAGIHCVLGDVLQMLGSFDAAVPHYRDAVRLAPDYAEAHAGLGTALQSLGQLEEAVASQRRALELEPGLDALHANVAMALHALERTDEAVASYRSALAVQEGEASLHNSLADALRNLGRFAEAESSCRRAIELDPDNASCQFGLASALQGQERRDEAIAAYLAALALRPDFFDARINLAATLLNTYRSEEALEHFLLALELQPDSVMVRTNLSITFQRLGRHEESLQQCELALADDADNAQLYFERGNSLHALHRVEDALASFQRSIDADPDYVPAHTNLTALLFGLGRTEQAIRGARRVLELKPDAAWAHSNLLFALSHNTTDAAALYAEHRRFGEQLEARLPPWAAHDNERDPARKIEVGFVSGDFNHHAVASFIEPVLALLKGHPQLSLHAYYNKVLDDPVTQRLRRYFDHWHQITGVDDATVARQIRADRIDVLIDLAGHSAANRLPLFAHKPAPVQASWLGYPGTTGLQAVDYYLSDHLRLPPGRYDGQFTEQIVRMPLSAPFMPERGAPKVAPLPALRNGYITFASFHRANKLSREVIALWARVLHAVPTSKIMLAGLGKGNANETLLGWFDAEGIGRERMLLRPRGSMMEYLEMHHDVDVCLNPFPYTGATTVCHALWMGVPTLTMTGPTIPSHGGASYLGHLGLDAFVADNEELFVQRGAFLADNLDALASLRAELRTRFHASVVGLPTIAAAGLDRAIRLMWQRWCSGQAPAPISIALRDLTVEAGHETSLHEADPESNQPGGDAA